MITHTIYHIPGKKVGCTNNLKRRMTQYPEGTEFVKIMDLEDFSDEDAGQVERWWQKLYGYRIDTVPYEKTIKNSSAGGKVGGRKNVESGQYKEYCSAGGKIGGRKNVESGQYKEYCSAGGKVQGPIQGRKNVESGRWKLCQIAGGEKQGPIQGRKSVESGHWDKCRQLGTEAAAKVHLGTHWYNNGIHNIQTTTCPEGFIPGMMKQTRSKKGT